jgi:anthranilate synthase/aminodeoxychorismate synthase-like glutamine amidotransferase
MPRLLFIDNFDSFSYILIDYLKSAGAEVEVMTNEVHPSDIQSNHFQGLVLSPGPATPAHSGHLMAYLETFVNRLPVLGVCLGHQAIGLHFGLSLDKAITPKHGKTSPVFHHHDPLFKDVPNPFLACRYHSLVLKGHSPDLETIAQTEQGEVMAVKHKTLPVYGVQFHPEALLTENGLQMVKNWVGMV